MTKTKQTNMLALLGLLIAAVAIFAATFLHFNHFYEFLVIGLFLALRPWASGSVNTKTYLYLYILFIAAGIICDLVMGIYLTGFWHYTYKYLWEYVALYFVIYPVAGLVMVQTYVIIKNHFLKVYNRGKREPWLSVKGYKYAAIILLGLLVINIIYLLTAKAGPNPLVIFFITATLLAFLLLSYVSQIHGHNTVIEDVHRHPLKITLILLLATYINAFLHEIPNTVARQWIYTNWPLESVKLFNIPVFVLVCWPLLLLVPTAFYYLILPSRKLSAKATLK